MNTTMQPIKSWKASFATIYTGQAFSIVGSAAVQFAIIWWITYRTESPIALTMATVASFLPNILIGPFAGVLVDRYNRRRVMMLADGFVALSSLVLMLVFMAQANPPIWVLYAVLFARGIGSTIHGPAMQAAIPMLVPVDKLTNVNGLASLVNSGAQMLGPVLGAALMGIFPIHAIMLVDILGAALAILSLSFVKIPSIPRTAEKTRVFRDLRSGFTALRANRPLMASAFPFIIANLMGAPLGALFPLLVLTHFGGDAWASSMSELAFGGGILLGSIVMSAFGGRKRRFRLIATGIMVMGVFASIGGFLPPWAFGIFLAGAVIMGVSSALVNVSAMSYIQESTPPEQLGKVLSLTMAVLSLTMPFGLFVAGPVSEIIGVMRWFIISGVIIVIAALWFFLATRKHENSVQ